MDLLFVDAGEAEDFLHGLAEERTVYAALETSNGFRWTKLGVGFSASMADGAYRCAEPVKSFLFTPRSIVSASNDASEERTTNPNPVMLLGAKACDLRSLKILDHVFAEGDYVDPFYVSRRRNTVIVGTDCTDHADSCFCAALGISPFPEDGFDIALSRSSDGGFLVETGTEKGAEVLRRQEHRLNTATETQRRDRGAARAALVDRLQKKVQSEGLPDPTLLQDGVRRTWESDLWERHAERCVECGACNLVCPTCHCFILQDFRLDSSGGGRALVWDSCQYEGFARVAGGANPRKRLAERVRNRLDKKFSYFPDALGIHACTGCGRCVEACIGNVDIRDILKEVAAR